MPPRASVEQLPADVKEWLDKALAEGGFAEYRALSDALRDRGFEISKSALHRYGQKFEERLAVLKRASEQARAIVDAAPDQEGAMNEALQRLVQERLFTVLQDIEVDPEKLNLTSLVRSIAELGRASVTQKKYAEEVRRQERERLEQTVDEVGEQAKRERLTPEQVLERVRAIYRGEA
ncbi:MAG: DUF3486 family protein [Desulfovibrionaceae bacterium]